MIQFKPLIKESATKIMIGAVEAARIVDEGQGAVLVTKRVNAAITVPDMLRILQRMGVKIEAGTAEKVETAMAKQQQIKLEAASFRAAAKLKPKAKAKAKARG